MPKPKTNKRAHKQGSIQATRLVVGRDTLPKTDRKERALASGAILTLSWDADKVQVSASAREDDAEVEYKYFSPKCPTCGNIMVCHPVKMNDECFFIWRCWNYRSHLITPPYRYVMTEVDFP